MALNFFDAAEPLNPETAAALQRMLYPKPEVRDAKVAYAKFKNGRRVFVIETTDMSYPRRV